MIMHVLKSRVVAHMAPIQHKTHTYSSVDISKVQILPIRHVAECCCIQISPIQATFLLALNLIAAPILQIQHGAQRNDQAGFDQMRDDHAPDTKRIFWLLICDVEEGPDDVAGAVAEE